MKPRTLCDFSDNLVAPPQKIPFFPPEIDYGRRVIYTGSNCEILEITWPPGRFCEIHDHGTARAEIYIKGEIESRTFVEDNGLLQMTSREFVNDSTDDGHLSVKRGEIHQMGNPSENLAVSIHLYFDDGTSSEHGYRLFDMISGAIRRSHGPAYFYPQAHLQAQVEKECSFVHFRDEVLHAETAIAHINRRIRDSPDRDLLNLRILLETRISRGTASSGPLLEVSAG